MPTDGVELASLVMGADLCLGLQKSRRFGTFFEGISKSKSIGLVAVRTAMRIGENPKLQSIEMIFQSADICLLRNSSRLADTPINYIYTLATATPEAYEGLSLDFQPCRRYS